MVEVDIIQIIMNIKITITVKVKAMIMDRVILKLNLNGRIMRLNKWLKVISCSSA